MNFPPLCRHVLLLAIAILFAVPLGAAGQQGIKSGDDQSSKSLGEIAKEAKKNKTPAAKKVITDDDIAPQRGPLPALKFDEDDNTDDIVDAMSAYRHSHTPEESEQLIHDWFDDYDSILRAALKSQSQSAGIQQSMSNYNYRVCQDSRNYQQCIARGRGEMGTAPMYPPMDNFVTVMRIQNAFHKVRDSLMRDNIRYKWFKIRTSNGYM
jgi:hypothetical protein